MLIVAQRRDLKAMIFLDIELKLYYQQELKEVKIVFASSCKKSRFFIYLGTM